ncbi:LexA family protein [Pectinatus frisingensis]|uniref:LexA family protein n=1 Tax=Pectinatus frisingensis TaxID=865 RepID=UPI0018C61FED|nr:S24 family peptidase [Pectinatus frisingensis]
MKPLKNLREKRELTQAALAKDLKISPSTIAMYERGDRNPDPDMLKKIANYFNVSIDYLLGNSIYGNTTSIYGNNTPIFNDVAPENKKVPIIGTVKCGPGGLAYEYLDGYIWVDDKLTGDIRAFHCKGDSMVGLGIFDGDIAVVRIQEDVENGELAVVVINGNEGTLKKVRKHDDVIILESANPAYPARIFSGKEVNTIHIVGKVLETRRKY